MGNATYRHSLGSNRWRGDGRRGRNQYIYLLQHAGVFFFDEALHFHGLGVIPPQHELASERAIQDVRAIVLSVLGEKWFVCHYTVSHTGNA